MKSKAQFLKSAVDPADYPPGGKPEVVLVGRSNAGKSSLLNAMTGGLKIAHISASPGKTRLLNFFDMGENYRLVDVPGYGYAARDLTEKKLWQKMVETYLFNRADIGGIVIVCDIRRTWSLDEKSVVDLAQDKKIPWICALTKKDKLTRTEAKRQELAWVKDSGFSQNEFMMVSSLKNDGVLDLERVIFKAWIKPRL